MAGLFWLNELQWAAIEPLLPHWGGKPRVDDRRIISGILHRFREGLRWRALPDVYGPISEVIWLQTVAKPSYRPRPIAKSQNHTTPTPIRCATSSSAPSIGSRIGAASQLARIRRRRISWLASASPPQLLTGCNESTPQTVSVAQTFVPL
jgi:transposase